MLVQQTDTFFTSFLDISQLFTANNNIQCISSFSKILVKYLRLDVEVYSAFGSGEDLRESGNTGRNMCRWESSHVMTGIQRDKPHEDYINLDGEHAPNGLLPAHWLKLPLNITTQGNKMPMRAPGEQSTSKLQRRGKEKGNLLGISSSLVCKLKIESRIGMCVIEKQSGNCCICLTGHVHCFGKNCTFVGFQKNI